MLEPQLHADCESPFGREFTRSPHPSFQQLSLNSFSPVLPPPAISPRTVGSPFPPNQANIWSSRTNSLPLRFPQQSFAPFQFSLPQHRTVTEETTPRHSYQAASLSPDFTSTRPQSEVPFQRSHSDPEWSGNSSDFLKSDNGIPATSNPPQIHIHQRRPVVGAAAPRMIAKKSPPVVDNSDSSDEDGAPNHPNKYAVAIEEHMRPECRYKRQSTRSGNYVKVIKDSGEAFCVKHNPIEPLEFDNGRSADRPQIVKYYRKDLVRVCRCGEYTSMEHMLENTGRANDAEGYEIHYNQKCKWKFYQDFKTKRKVLIRLCKCYKPAV